MAEHKTVSVTVANAPYKVHVGPGLLDDVGHMLRELTPAKRVAILTDSEVGPLHLTALRDSLSAAGFDGMIASIPAGEENKHLETLLPVYDAFLAAKMERGTPVVALGGGVVGDMGGLVAATCLRGVPFVQVPTSLLAMVDASVGGKTGVNHEVGKNLIGAFHQPIAVYIDTLTLRTLPKEELRAGLAECIKHEIIADAEGFERLEKSIVKALRLDVEFLSELVAHNVSIKAKFVEADPLENGVRAHLNLGHTFGHAIENVTGYVVSHGEAVALGMVAAVIVANNLGMLDTYSKMRVISLIQAAGLPIREPELDIDDTMQAMFLDKKVRNGKLRLVLPDGIGKAVVRDDVPMDLVRDAVYSLRG